ncbi:hypothetical protein [Actinacidiphila paucisporea]|uniref:Uncharacterized protein n=1 Tax=Actinacidiphila paucisporea TaxID=310782 RepID=A0A1M7EJZ3_9ACTN|nr:hypothetical protein [Actinacidiphila paucisporea]SHL92092.1 hypothetical protein SAMN05216499_1074 [Actinacidiphila paucisporea]
MDIAKGLEYLAFWFALIVLGSIVATMCLVALALALIAAASRAVRWGRARSPGAGDG